jgi:replicative DNA helicase
VSTLEYQIDNMPANADAERSILGAIMLEPKAYDEAAANGLTSADLSLDSHRRIYAAMQSVAESGRPIDTVTLPAELDSRRELDRVGGYAYIADLFDGVPDRPSIKHYIRIVKEKASLRKLIHACNATIVSIGDGCTSQIAIEELGERILQVQTGSDAAPAQRVISFSDQVYSEWAQLAEGHGNLIGLPTSLESLDVATTGIRQGELWVIGGRTGDGKTALALQIAAANCRNGVPVGFFSIEMAKGDLLQRLWSHEGRIPFQRIRYPRNLDSDTRHRVQSAMCDVGKWPLFVVEDSSLSIQKLVAKARLLIRQERIQLIIVDYMQLVSPRQRRRRNA